MNDVIVSSLISEIKFEAKLNSTTQYDSWLLSVLNEELNALYAKHNYSDNVADTVLVFTAGTPYITLPTNFVRMESNIRLKFYDVNSPNSFSFIDPTTDRRRKYSQGFPRYYEIKNGRIYFYPYDASTADHRIDLSYYKSPSNLTLVSTVKFEFASVIKHRAIGRMLILSESKMASAHLSLAKERFEDSV